MVWTYLRSCYSFTMRVFIGGVVRTFPARWYFCAAGAKRFPFPHGAESSVWLDNYESNPYWGEVTPYPTDPGSDVFRGLDRGLNPGYAGQCYTGDPQWFIDGELPAGILDGPPPPFDPCCRVQPTVGSGGLVLAGTAVKDVLCQATDAGKTEIDIGDGTGYHLCQQVQATHYRLADPGRGGFYWQTNATVSGCRGHTRSLFVYMSTDPAGLNAIAQLALVAASPDGRVCQWQVPSSSPVNPGEVITVQTLS